MIYIILNVALAVFLVGLTFYIGKSTNYDEYNPLNTMSFILAAAAGCMACAVGAASIYNDQITRLFGRLAVIAFSAYSVDFCVYCVLFPSFERPRSAQIVRWVLILASVWFAFMKIHSVSISGFIGLKFESDPLFSGSLTNYFPYTLYEFYRVLVIVALPALSVLIMLLRCEASEDRLNMQKAVMTAISLILCWVAIFLISGAAKRVPMFMTLILFAAGFAHVIIVYSSIQSILYDFLYIFGIAVNFTICYLIPAAFVGLAFPQLWPIISTHPTRFFIYIAIVLVAAITFSYQLAKLLARKTHFRSFQYAETFEKALTKINYNNEPEAIVRETENVFSQNIGLSEMRILIDAGSGKLESVYDKEGRKMIELDVSTKLFDTLLNQNWTIVLRSVVLNGQKFRTERNELLKIFNETKTNVLIILNEGRRIIGALLLGPKAGGNVYGDYDYKVFTNLYSYFFVFGYYMKNIAQQSVVGTVNREIRMSAQIIESIQKNMDPIRNKNFDTGYIMEHAHNIGGEFVDLIRLTESRHIVIIGDLSGKGISASMSMVIVKSIIRTFLAETKNFKLLVEKVNSFIRFNLPKGTFFEGLFGLIDFSNNTFYYINCGVPALFMYTRAFNNVMEIQGEGHVLGFVKDISPYIKVKKIALNPGDIIVTCSDGLIDSKSLRGETYGKDRIQKSIIDNIIQPADKIAKAMHDECLSFLAKGLDDDVSVLVLKYLSES